MSPSQAKNDHAWLTKTIRMHFGARGVLLTDSGTSALVLALRLAGEHSSHAPVALPAFGCYDLATAVDGAGATVLLYDVDPSTLAPEPGSLRTVMAERLTALVVVHLYGIPIDIAGLRIAQSSPDVLLIEDVAQGFGTRLHGQPVGTFGSMAVLSFGRGKGLAGGKD